MRFNLVNDRFLDLSPSRGTASMKPTLGRAPGSIELDAAVAAASAQAAAAGVSADEAEAAAAAAATFNPAAYIAKPAGGSNGDLLTKSGTTAVWSPPPDSLPPGGADGQVLTKQSGADGDANWENLPSSTAPPALLAYTVRTAGTATSYSSTSTSPADIDATNLAVTFTVPTSGVVVVVLEGSYVAPTPSGSVGHWSLRQGATNVVGSERLTFSNDAGTGSSTTQRTSARIRLSGLTPGASITYKWAWRVTSGTHFLRYGGAEFSGFPLGPATMEVWAG